MARQGATHTERTGHSWRLAKRKEKTRSKPKTDESKPRPLTHLFSLSSVFVSILLPSHLSGLDLPEDGPGRDHQGGRSPDHRLAVSGFFFKTRKVSTFFFFSLLFSPLRNLKLSLSFLSFLSAGPKKKKTLSLSTSAATPPSRPTSTPTRASSPPPSPRAPPPASTRPSSSATAGASTWARASARPSPTSTS